MIHRKRGRERKKGERGGGFTSLAYMVRYWDSKNECLILATLRTLYLLHPSVWMSQQSQSGAKGLNDFESW